MIDDLKKYIKGEIMNADHFKQELLALEEKLKETTQPQQQPSPHNARHLYFELQRLVHQYANTLIRVIPSKTI